MQSPPSWVTECNFQNCEIFHDDVAHVMWDLVNHLNIRKENRVFLYFEGGIPACRVACFVHWVILHIDFEETNIFVWA